MTIENMSNELKNDILDVLERSHEYKKLREAYISAIYARDYVESVKISRKIKQAKEKALLAYIESYEKLRRENLKTFDRSESKERLELELNVVTIHLMCDVLEVACMNSNAILKRNTGFERIDMYDRLLELAAECKKQVKFFDDTVDIDYSAHFGDKADRLYKEAMSAAGVLTRASLRRRNKKNKQQKEHNNEER